MGLMATIEAALHPMQSRRDFIFSFARKGRDRDRDRDRQPPRRPNIDRSTASPQPPGNGGFKLSRRSFIVGGVVLAAGAVVTAITKPWEKFTEIETLNPEIEANTRKEILKFDNYPSNLRQKMVNFWLQGATAVQYTKLQDNQSYLLSFDQAKSDSNLKAMAKTIITLQRRRLSTGGSSLVFTLSGTYHPALEESSPEQMKDRITSMNFEHEGIVSIAYINGLISVGKDLGLDFKSPSQPLSQESHQLSELKKYMPAVIAYAEAVAEINDYILTYPLFDKDPQGQILFFNHPSSQKPLPLIAGKAFLENGLTFIVDQTIGTSIKGANNIDQLTQRYPSVESIPGSLEYIRQIQKYFQMEK